jgi:hypothetical protein
MNTKITIVAFVTLVLTGCVTTTVNVIDHKPVTGKVRRPGLPASRYNRLSKV